MTGTPGTGKKTIAPLLTSLAGLPEPIAINSLARRGEVDVDPSSMRERLQKAVDPRGAVVFGHLLPHLLNKRELRSVVVLRCEPSVLRRRLVARGYPPSKVVANIESELIGTTLDECVRNFGSLLIHEYDTTSASPESVAASIFSDLRLMSDRAMGNEKDASDGSPPAWIDWTLRYDSPTKLRSLLGGTTEVPFST